MLILLLAACKQTQTALEAAANALDTRPDERPRRDDRTHRGRASRVAGEDRSVAWV